MASLFTAKDFIAHDRHTLPRRHVKLLLASMFYYDEVIKNMSLDASNLREIAKDKKFYGELIQVSLHLYEQYQKHASLSFNLFAVNYPSVNIEFDTDMVTDYTGFNIACIQVNDRPTLQITEITLRERQSTSYQAKHVDKSEITVNGTQVITTLDAFRNYGLNVFVLIASMNVVELENIIRSFDQ